MASLGNALNLHWAFGFSKDRISGVESLSANNRNALFFMSSHSGVIYDFENRTQTILQGHCNVITCCAIDSNKRWIVTADAGYDPIIVVWDAISCVPVKTFTAPHPFGVDAIDISEDALYISTLSARDPSGTSMGSEQELAIWAWTREENEPIVKQSIAATEHHHTIKFDCRLSSQIVTTGDKTICFWNWNELSLESYYGRASQKDLGKYTGHFVSTVFLPGTDNAVTATSTGYVIVWETQSNSKKTGVTDKTIKVATKVLRLVECGINIMGITPNDYLVVGCSDGAIRFYDFFLRLEAWFEDLSAGPVNSVSFAVQPCPFAAGEAGSPGLKFWCPDFLVGTSDAFVIGVESSLFDEVRKENRRGTLLMQGMADEVTSLSAHPSQHLLAITSRNGILQIWNYEMKLLMMLREFNVSKNSSKPDDKTAKGTLYSNCCSFDATGNLIAVGFSSGIIRLLSSDTLEDFASYAPSSEGIQSIKFSQTGAFFAASDSSHHVMIFKREERDADLFNSGLADDKRIPSYVYLGRALSHSATITGLEFGTKDGMETLVSIAEDRYCVEYDLQGSSISRGIQVVPTVVAASGHGKRNNSVASHYVELVAKPTALMWHPRVGDDVEDRFVFANDEFKFKELNLDSKQCRKTSLAPRFGAPTSRLVHIPKLSPSSNALSSAPEVEPPQYFAFSASSRVIGVGAFPLTGSPNEVMGIVAHPSDISAITTTFDGKFLFSAGGRDLSVNMWELDLPDTSIFTVPPAPSEYSNDDYENGEQHLSKLAALRPFLSLLEGGEDGELHGDIVDYFYYCQLRSCSEDSMDPRNLPGCIPLEEIPSLFRSVGYYPSEVEVTNVINEIRYKKFMITGETQDTVDLTELIKLYVNHRPVLPLDHEYITSAFTKISDSLYPGQDVPGTVLQWERIKDCLANHGEKISADDLNSYLAALVGEDAKSIAEDAAYDPKAFAELFLGFEDFES